MASASRKAPPSAGDREPEFVQLQAIVRDSVLEQLEVVLWLRQTAESTASFTDRGLRQLMRSLHNEIFDWYCREYGKRAPPRPYPTASAIGRERKQKKRPYFLIDPAVYLRMRATAALHEVDMSRVVEQAFIMYLELVYTPELKRFRAEAAEAATKLLKRLNAARR